MEVVLKQSCKTSRPEFCEVCGQKAVGFNYDVPTCSACKMFFRRSLTETFSGACKREGKCYEGDMTVLAKRPKCRHCRLNRCNLLGMRLDEPQVAQSLVTPAHSNSTLLQTLSHLSNTRYSVYSVISVCENPTFCDMVAQDSRLGVYARPQAIHWESTDRRMKPWGSLGVMLAGEMVKTMDFYKQLLLSDRLLLLKHVAFKSHHLSIAYDSYRKKKGMVLTPQDELMFPPLLMSIPACAPIMMELFTAPIEPLIRLQLTENEYLLLNMIVICNPGIQGLSPGGQAILAQHQQVASQLLFHQCMQENPKNGPSRFAAILAINQTLDRQIGITQRLDRAVRVHWDPNYKLANILHEACRMEEFNKTIKN